jgi:two-component system sensor histidine kinase/response regulator
VIPDCALLEEHVNLSELLARVEDDRELLAELFAMFLEELPGLQNALHTALGLGDLREAAKAAHTLKGVLANLSMNQATSLAARIEAAAQAGDASTIDETITAFDLEIAALSAGVGDFVAGQ